MVPTGAATRQEENEQSEEGTLNIILTPQARLDKLEKIASLAPSATPRPKATASSLPIGYVAYRDGYITYYKGDQAVLSSEFSGCLFTAYRKGAERRVAHIPKSDVADNDCLPTFREKMESKDYTLINYFQPFIRSEHNNYIEGLFRKAVAEGMSAQIDNYTVMGLIASDNKCYSVFVIKADKHNYDVIDIIERTAIANVHGIRKKPAADS